MMPSVDPLIPNEEERRRLSYMLKKNSSYTAWARVAGYHATWTGLFKSAVEHARSIGEEWWFRNGEQDLIDASGFDECLLRLKRGDKRPFKFLGQRGYIYQAVLPLQSMSTDISRYEWGENALPEIASPWWNSLVAAMVAEGRAEREVGEFILEGRLIDDPAPLGYRVLGNRGPTFLMEYSTFPEGELAAVPEPEDLVLLRTGDIVPYSGIWEPVKVEYSKGILGMLQKPRLPLQGDLELDGLMNYLHVGSPAPTIEFPGDSPRNDGRPTVWRLIWRDDRYEDGRIPEEEALYTFRCPEWPHVPWKEFLPPEHEDVHGGSPVDGLRCVAGAACSRTGYWMTPAKPDSRRHFREGDVMPELGSDYGVTIWQWDEHQ